MEASETLTNTVDNEDGVNTRVKQQPRQQLTAQMPSRINWDKCMYVIFDLETTGDSRTDDNIIKIAAMVIGPDLIMVEYGTFL
jgi:DNA polymerase III epsilon subunit-like protein